MNRAIGRHARIDLELIKQRVEPHLGPKLAHAHPKRAVAVVLAQGNHGMVEAGIAHAGHGQQQPAREILG